MNLDSNIEAPTTARPETPPVRQFDNRLPDRIRFTKTVAGLVALLAGAFLFLSFRPLWHTDLWGHLAYGRLIWESGSGVLYGNEPLMPLSQGVPFVDTAWLSQAIGSLAYKTLGVTALQFLFALSITSCLGLLTWRFYHRSRSGLVTVLGLIAFLLVAWQQMFVNTPSVFSPSALIRPQIAGWVCFIAVFACLTSRRWHKVYWALIPAIFALWANLHGSFLAGLMVMGCFLAGRAIDIQSRTRRFGSIVKDRWTQRYLLLLELSAVAVLLNPYGLRIYAAVLAISENPNMTGLIEWDALTLRSNQGAALAFIAVVLMFLYRWSPRRVKTVEVLLLLSFGGLTLYYSRFMTWLAPIAAYSIVLHGNAVLKEDRKKLPATAAIFRKSFVYTVVCLVLWAVCFVMTPFGGKLLRNQEPEFARSVGVLTPIRAVEYLNTRAAEGDLPSGLIFNSFQWGDYLLWAGPPNVPVFVASHVQFIPELIWQQYFDVVSLKAGYQTILDMQGVNLIVLSKSQHGELIEQLQRDGTWSTDFEDDQAVVLVRENPI